MIPSSTVISRNTDDDNGNSVDDLDESGPILGEDDLVQLSLDVQSVSGVELPGWHVRLEAPSGDSLIRVWDSPDKNNELLLGTGDVDWVLASGTPAGQLSAVYIEGYDVGEVELNLVELDPFLAEKKRLRVNLTVARTHAHILRQVEAISPNWFPMVDHMVNSDGWTIEFRDIWTRTRMDFATKTITIDTMAGVAWKTPRPLADQVQDVVRAAHRYSATTWKLYHNQALFEPIAAGLDEIADVMHVTPELLDMVVTARTTNRSMFSPSCLCFEYAVGMHAAIVGMGNHPGYRFRNDAEIGPDHRGVLIQEVAVPGTATITSLSGTGSTTLTFTDTRGTLAIGNSSTIGGTLSVHLVNNVAGDANSSVTSYLDDGSGNMTVTIELKDNGAVGAANSLATFEDIRDAIDTSPAVVNDIQVNVTGPPNEVIHATGGPVTLTGGKDGDPTRYIVIDVAPGVWALGTQNVGLGWASLRSPSEMPTGFTP